MVEPSRRLFVALRPPAPLAAELLRLAHARLGALEVLRWVRPAELHLTLAFLGAVPEDRAPELEAALSAELAGREAPRCTVRGAGAFPGPRRARVLWFGVEDPSARLATLHRAAAAGAARAGLALDPADLERGFAPHLTVARVRRGARLAEGGALAGFLALECALSWEPGAALLFESRPADADQRYRVRATFDLARGSA